MRHYNDAGAHQIPFNAQQQQQQPTHRPSPAAVSDNYTHPSHPSHASHASTHATAHATGPSTKVKHFPTVHSVGPHVYHSSSLNMNMTLLQQQKAYEESQQVGRS